MFLLYFILWVVFNGQITLEICVFGILVAALIFAFACRYMDYSMKKELLVYRKLGKLVQYVFTLVWEVVKANLGTVHLILTQKEEIQPVLVSFHSDLKSSVGRTLLANAITLTPGTITVTLENGDYTVHCLDESLAEGMDQSVFAELARELEQ
ncbi:MAG: Na+/H+ antiporter subunit E [bacterium]|nr:Na+/H+ antiporter subunit E [bacterium]MCM1374453.1 Na+/H+ antiporter subunit E [Muribaculum sp.]